LRDESVDRDEGVVAWSATGQRDAVEGNLLEVGLARTAAHEDWQACVSSRGG